MAFTYTTRADGRLMKRVSVNGKLKTLYSDNVKDLEKQYTELKYLQNKGITTDDENMNVSELADTWLTEYKRNVAKGTYKMYEGIIRLYIKPYIGNIRLKKLKQSDVVTMINKMTEKGLTKTRNDTLIVIKSMLEIAIDNDLIYKNVAKGIKLPKHRYKEKVPLEDETIAKIKDLAKINDNAFMILFLIYTGLRRGEIIALQYKDIDIENKKIHITKSTYIESNQAVIKDTKNHENRIVPIFDIISEQLRIKFKSHSKYDYVFTNAQNKMMSATSIRRKIESINKELGSSFTLHQLRHTFACLLYKANINTKQAQIWTGHKDIRVLLDIYTHLDSQDNQQAVDKVNQFLG